MMVVMLLELQEQGALLLVTKGSLALQQYLQVCIVGIYEFNPIDTTNRAIEPFEIFSYLV
jgi:hypothetical protein